MLIEPTYTAKQYWITILISGLIVSVFSIVTYLLLYCFLYVPHSYMFSLIYFIPLLGSAMTLAFFKHKFVWDEFSYKSAFVMSFITSLLSAVIFSIFLFFAYHLGLETRIELYNIEDQDTLLKLMSPLAISLSMFLINLILSLLFSLLIAIFAKRKKSN